ncbi:Myophilin [Echinococcus multilocularis]|uniref:Myophilin n=1 Tax=Echinococcus multilocularis TaxID=6211 RepID=A0A068Y2V7_ECHMU|nr:Myophilin [Echinococcus multilocularis]
MPATSPPIGQLLGHLLSLARTKAMSNVPPPSGLSYQVKKKLEGKRDKDQENEALEWIEALTGLKLDRSKLYEDILKDGTVLCKLMNSIKPGCIKKINENATMPFKIMENISAFLEAMKVYGVPVADLFQTVDLFEKKDIAQVTRTLFALGRTCQTHPEYSGPVLGPKLATENKREFTEQQLREGQNVVSLQFVMLHSSSPSPSLLLNSFPPYLSNSFNLATANSPLSLSHSLALFLLPLPYLNLR